MSFNIYKEFESDTKYTVCNVSNACLLISNVFNILNFGIVTLLLLFLQKEMKYAKQTINDIEYMMPELDNITYRMNVYDQNFEDISEDMKSLKEQLSIIIIIIRRLTKQDTDYHYDS